jgi:D-psicose/D-tagatose/L-ribulose 3-epimerase
MRYAICNELFECWEIEKVLSYCAKTGYHGVEIAPFTLANDIRELSSARRSAVRASAKNAGIEITGLHWLLVKPAGLHINSPEAPVREKTIDYMHALVEACAELGGKVLVFGSPKQRAVTPAENWSDVFYRSVDIFKGLGEHAPKHGCVIAF